jgi:2-dehydropantoate 2-reductase
LNRVQPGVIHHLDHGRIVLGDFGHPSQPHAPDLATAFVHAGVPCVVTEDLARAHWEKLVWNIPFNGLGVASVAGYKAFKIAVEGGGPLEARPLHPCLTTDQLLADPRWEKLLRGLMGEVIAAAGGQGFSIRSSLIEDQIRRTRTMGAYRASTLIDFERGQPLELHALFLEPLRQAQAAGVDTPLLAALCVILQKLQNH